MKELWADISGYEGLYEVSNHGRVRSPKRVMSPYRAAQKGYPAIKLSGFGQRRAFYVHELVAAAFLGPRPEGMDVMHLDDNPLNNCPDNLQYGTRAENIAMRSERHQQGENHYQSKLTGQDVRDLRSGAKTCNDVALERGVSYQTAHDAKAGRNWRHLSES